jgi:hypothetical protein
MGKDFYILCLYLRWYSSNVQSCANINCARQSETQQGFGAGRRNLSMALFSL